jgi:diguanylate cyclase (GGDEF)-like protein
VLSLKPYLDAKDEPILPALLDSYQRLLATTASCNADLCAPSAGERHLQAWHDRTQTYLRQKTAEMKDLMLLVAKTAESVGDRDQRHNTHLQSLTSRLKQISELEDISRLRSSLVSSVEELSRTVEQMTHDTQQTMRALEVELSNYRSRLAQTEEQANLDALTGLANRRRLELDLATRIRRAQPFSLILIDLNRFKQVNDTYGHLAGDQILRQFSAELRQVCHQFDLVGRWGGDEFLVLINGATTQAEALCDRIRQWVFGTYPIKVEPGQPSVKVEVTASLGIASWQNEMSAEELLQLADAHMYQQKSRKP